MKSVWPARFWTGTSKLATDARRMPNTSKNSFQNVWASDRSRAAVAQLPAKTMARRLISFQFSCGMAAIPGRGKLRRRPVR